MKYTRLWLLLAIPFLSCQKDIETHEIIQTPTICEGDIKINFYNLTEEVIGNIIIDDVYIVSIKSNQWVGQICFEEFRIDTGWPDCRMSGTYKGKKLESTSKFYWCGTEKSKLEPGEYEIEIRVVKWQNTEYFDLHFKQ